jgi:hypothetical protein
MSNSLMSNGFARSGTAPSNAAHRHLFHCAAVLLALAAAAVITVPKLETTAVSTADTATQTVANAAAPDTTEGCVQSWPYYERSCLHDSRAQDGNGRSVRLIATGRPAPRHVSHQ